MPRLIDRYPNAGPWITGGVTAALMLLTSLFDEGSFVTHVVQSLVVGAVVFVVTRALHKESNEHRDSEKGR